MESIRPSMDRIRELRETEGLITARRIATREALLHAIRYATTLDDIKAILLTMLEEDER